MASSGNFCTLSPLDRSEYGTAPSLTGGNLRYQTTGSGPGNNDATRGTMATPTTGKWYFEFVDVQNYTVVGMQEIQPSGVRKWNTNGYPVTQSGISQFYVFLHQGDVNINNSNTSSAFTTFSDGDIGGIAIDLDNGAFYLHNAGTYVNSGDPTSGSSKTGSLGNITTGKEYIPITCNHSYGSDTRMYFNFGQDSTFQGYTTAGGNADENGFGDFKYAPPSGYLALCSANLPISDDIDPAQTDDDIPQKQFNAVLYTGNASTRNITGVDFQPDLVITRGRSEASVGKVVDSSRGVTKVIQTHSNSAESTDSNGLTAFGSDGYSLGSDAGYNNNSTTYVAWCWRCNGGTTTTDTSGDISTVRQTNAAGGFAILEWTGNGSNNQRLAHGLGKKPTLVIAKRLDSAQSWGVWSTFLGANSKEIQLDSNAAWQATGNAWYESGMTTDFVGIGSDRNISSSSNVAYVWTDIEGYSKCGSSYLGNANADGAFVYTGFRPRYIILRAVNVASDGWLAYDTAREPFNVMDSVLQLHLSSAEYSNAAFRLDVLSNGFKLRSADNAVNGTSYDPYIYFAWGDVPYKYNNAQ